MKRYYVYCWGDSRGTVLTREELAGHAHEPDEFAAIDRLEVGDLGDMGDWIVIRLKDMLLERLEGQGDAAKKSE